MFVKEWTILEVFSRKPWEGLTFGQVKERSKNKSDNYVFSTLKKYVRLGVLKEKKYGNVIVYSLAHNEISVRIMSFVSEYKTQKMEYLPHKNIEKLMRGIPTSFFTFIITGSYAEKKQTKKSDLDVVLICDNGSNIKKILLSLKDEGELMIPRAHPYVFTEGQFFQMLVNSEENYGKEIARKHLIVSGAESFYRILFRAIDNGFKG
ncbi:MAG: nucleotidyltransferase domain-containing protein [Candidatus Aenigmarchaeota archaeon]|nr:nucleotidyltransferase domain-containing protein [Candidatus Aenigmarchaeota archaeon]